MRDSHDQAIHFPLAVYDPGIPASPLVPADPPSCLQRFLYRLGDPMVVVLLVAEGEADLYLARLSDGDVSLLPPPPPLGDLAAAPGMYAALPGLALTPPNSEE